MSWPIILGLLIPQILWELMGRMDLFTGRDRSAGLATRIIFESCTAAVPWCSISNYFRGKPVTLQWHTRPSKSWGYPDTHPRSTTRLSLPAATCSAVPHPIYPICSVGLEKNTLQITAAELVMSLYPILHGFRNRKAHRGTKTPSSGPRKSDCGSWPQVYRCKLTTWWRRAKE